jgi:hypothetical protein
MKTMNASCLAIAVATLFCTASAHAAECRVTSSVEASATSVQANTDAGGHVSIHVRGNKTEAGKSQFQSGANFTSAFQQWSAYSGPKGPTPKPCGGGDKGVMDCVPASLVGMGANSGYVCQEVDDKGKCTRGYNFTPTKVAFRYAKNDKGKWILNTAYPTTNNSCQ